MFTYGNPSHAPPLPPPFPILLLSFFSSIAQSLGCKKRRLTFSLLRRGKKERRGEIEKGLFASLCAAAAAEKRPLRPLREKNTRHWIFVKFSLIVERLKENCSFTYGCQVSSFSAFFFFGGGGEWHFFRISYFVKIFKNEISTLFYEKTKIPWHFSS